MYKSAGIFVCLLYLPGVFSQCSFYENNCVFPSDNGGSGQLFCYLEGRSGNETLHKSPTDEPNLDEVLAQTFTMSEQNKGCLKISQNTKFNIYLVSINFGM